MKRNLKVKRISDLITDFVKKNKVNKIKDFNDFFNLWKEVVGKDTASNTQSVVFKNRVLYIKILDTALKDSLKSQKDKIINNIKKINPNIDKICFN